MNNLAELLLIIFIIKWIGILLFAFLGIRFLVVLSNLLRSNKLDRCTLADLKESETPMVSILIPARNEEKIFQIFLMIFLNHPIIILKSLFTTTTLLMRLSLLFKSTHRNTTISALYTEDHCRADGMENNTHVINFR